MSMNNNINPPHPQLYPPKHQPQQPPQQPFSSQLQLSQYAAAHAHAQAIAQAQAKAQSKAAAHAQANQAQFQAQLQAQAKRGRPPGVTNAGSEIGAVIGTAEVGTIPKNPNAEPPSWTMKIVGRILEDGVDPEQAGLMANPNPIYPNNTTPDIESGLEVKRKGDREFPVHIKLEMAYLPEKFKLSAPLMEVLGIEVDTRARISSAIWQYVKARKLQNADDPSFFNCDPPLLKVFGEEKVKFTMVPQKISNHLSPPQPVHLEHKIKLSGNSPAGNACYDVLVDVPVLSPKELNGLLAYTDKTKEIEAYDEGICTVIRKINEHREASRNAEKEHRADFYNQTWVEDAVIRYLNRRPGTRARVEAHK
ncbi:SWI/SNF complex component SNF12 [Tanacetum coccineum]